MNDAPNLSPGLYILSQDVINPDADRRYRNDWRMESVIKAGTKFRVITYEPCGPGLDEVSWPQAHLDGKWSSQTVHLAGSGRLSQLGLVLAPLLRPAPRTMASVLGDHDVAPSKGSGGWLEELLAYMLDSGRITLDALEADCIALVTLREVRDDGEYAPEMVALLKKERQTAERVLAQDQARQRRAS